MGFYSGTKVTIGLGSYLINLKLIKPLHRVLLGSDAIGFVVPLMRNYEGAGESSEKSCAGWPKCNSRNTQTFRLLKDLQRRNCLWPHKGITRNQVIKESLKFIGGKKTSQW